MLVDPTVHKLIREFEIPASLPFGEYKVPVMYTASYRDGQWLEGTLGPYHSLSLDPAAKCLHYAVEAFEGMKAFGRGPDRPVIFRPDSNWQRLNRSLARIAAPEVPREMFFEAISAITSVAASAIPTGPGQSLYLRPFVISTDSNLGGIGLSREYLFCVIACPADVYQTTPMRLLIERQFVRAVPGGTGSVKIGGNYAAAILSNKRAAERGLTTSLWLDAGSGQWVEELSAMNFFVAINGTLHTPALTDTILPGITRDSIIQLAQNFGIEVFERAIGIDEILDGVRSGAATEAFACGTAAAILPIGRLEETDGSFHEFSDTSDPIWTRLRSELRNVQEGRVSDPFGWIYEVPLLTSGQ